MASFDFSCLRAGVAVIVSLQKGKHGGERFFSIPDPAKEDTPFRGYWRQRKQAQSSGTRTCSCVFLIRFQETRKSILEKQQLQTPQKPLQTPSRPLQTPNRPVQTSTRTPKTVVCSRLAVHANRISKNKLLRVQRSHPRDFRTCLLQTLVLNRLGLVHQPTSVCASTRVPKALRQRQSEEEFVEGRFWPKGVYDVYLFN